MHARSWTFPTPESDAPELNQTFIEICYLFLEPVSLPGARSQSIIRSDLFDAEGRYDWGASDLPRNA